MHPQIITRRRVFQGMAFGTACLLTPGVFAEALTLTPKQTAGPFYPDKLPLDTDNDLIVINDALTPAVGNITHLTGRVMDASGSPIRNAVVEIWQCDANGNYLHSRGEGGKAKRDGNFQGFGRFLTNRDGQYYFRTIKPVPYPGRTPHIHYAVKRKGQEDFTTQCYIKGEAQNESDGVIRGIRDPKALASVMVDFRKIEEAGVEQFAAEFNIVIGKTPEA